MRSVLQAAWACLAACGMLFTGSLVAADFPTPFNSERDESAAPLPAAEAAAGMAVPAGFRVGVFAAEPDVRNPIAMAWDARGRLWVAENHTYAERPLRLDVRLRDRVVILTDTDGDGRADSARTFIDGLLCLTGLERAADGLWLICPPRLLFVPDADGDDVPDGPPRVVLDGFDVATDNSHNFANGLKVGPDGWLYGRCGGSCPGLVGPPGAAAADRVRLEGGVWRYAPRTGRFEVLVHGMTNSWGHDWNEVGDGFCINTVTGHLWQIIPGAHYPFNGRLDPNPHAFEPIAMHADHWHFDTGAGWQKSRHGAANDHGGGHAHSGLTIYLGDDWPAEYRGRLFTWNFHGRRANQEILEREGSGYVGRHGPDMLLSSDPFFRGIDLGYGPDGGVLAIDWSDTGECHEATGVHRTSGRVYRITHGDQPRSARVDLARLAPAALAALTTHPNEWFVRQARLQLAARFAADAAGCAAAERILRGQAAASDPVTALRAVLTLHACRRLGPADREKLLDHAHEHLRAWGVRLLTDEWPIDGVHAPPRVPADEAAEIAAASARLEPAFVRLAADDPSGLVRLALASALQRLPVPARAAVAARLMARSADAADHNLPLLVWYGLMPVVEADPLQAADLAAESTWPKTRRLIARRLAMLIDQRGPHAAGGEGVARIVATAAATADAALQSDLVRGLADGLAGWRRAPKPANWDTAAAALGRDDEQLAAVVRDLSALFGDGRAAAETRRLVLDANAPAEVRRAALESLVRQGAPELRDLCLGLLRDRRLQVVAATGLARSDDPDAARALLAAYPKFRSDDRPGLVAILSSRPAFARELLAAVAAGTIPRGDLAAHDLRQIRGLGDPAANALLDEHWGDVRTTPEEKQRRIESLRRDLTPAALAAADPTRGRVQFERHCSRCHRLFGAGEAFGPDLTGGNRTNLDHLLENLVDPGGVVPHEYRLSIVRLTDGRVLGGLVAGRDETTLTLVTPTGRQVIPRADVESVEVTPQSPMPEGLLDPLSADEIRDLIGYLMQPAQVPHP